MTNIQKDGTIVSTPSSVTREGSASNVLRSSARSFLGGSRDENLTSHSFRENSGLPSSPLGQPNQMLPGFSPARTPAKQFSPTNQSIIQSAPNPTNQRASSRNKLKDLYRASGITNEEHSPKVNDFSGQAPIRSKPVEGSYMDMIPPNCAVDDTSYQNRKPTFISSHQNYFASSVTPSNYSNNHRRNFPTPSSSLYSNNNNNNNNIVPNPNPNPSLLSALHSNNNNSFYNNNNSYQSYHENPIIYHSPKSYDDDGNELDTLSKFANNYSTSSPTSNNNNNNRNNINNNINNLSSINYTSQSMFEEPSMVNNINKYSNNNNNMYDTPLFSENNNNNNNSYYNEYDDDDDDDENDDTPYSRRSNRSNYSEMKRRAINNNNNNNNNRNNSSSRRKQQQINPNEGFGRKETNSKKEVPENINEKLVKNEKDQLYFSKKARQVNYQPKTLAEYKSQKTDKYYELGTLPPDLNRDDLVEKRKIVDKMKQYGEEMSKLNRQKLSQNPPKQKQPPPPKEKSNREKALEFAKNIPKPVVKPKSKPVQQQQQKDISSPVVYEDDSLAVLEKQHQEYEMDIESMMKQYL